MDTVTVTASRHGASVRHLPRVVFHRHGRPPLDASAYVVNLRTTKTLGEPCGSWSVTLKANVLDHTGQRLPVTDWLDEVSDDDWAILGFDLADQPVDVMVGLVDAIRRSRTAGTNGAEVLTWTISGRDLGKCLVDSEVLFIPGLPFEPALEGYFVDAIAALQVGQWGPAPVLKAILEHFLRGDTVWKTPETLPNGQTLGKYLSLAFADNLEGVIVVDEVIAGVRNGARLWQALDGLANRPFNELWLDVVGKGEGGRPTLHLRRCPFPEANDRTLWDQLDRHELPEEVLEEEQLARNGRERLNLFLARYPESLGADPYALALAEQALSGKPLGLDSVPAVDLASVALHGLRTYEVTTRYLDTTNDHPAALRRWTHRLRDWFAKNAELLSGSLRTWRLYPRIRVGHRLTLTRRSGAALELYVEGVEHTLSIGDRGQTKGSTTLTVTRGISAQGANVSTPQSG